MTKHYCDCCGQEQDNNTVSMKLELAVHTIQETGIIPGYAAVNNGKWESFSARYVSLLLCLTCYNLVAAASTTCLKELREMHNNTNPLPS